MVRRTLITAAATLAALAGMVSAQVPNIIANSNPSTLSSPAALSSDGNSIYGSMVKYTFGISGGQGTVSVSAVPSTGLPAGSANAQVLASGDGTILATTSQPGLPLPDPYAAPSALTFSQSNTTVWISDNSGTSWTRMPLFPNQAHCGGNMMSLYDMSTDGRYLAGQGYVRVVYNSGANASNCTVHGWVYDRQTNTLSDLSDTFGGPTGQQRDIGTSTFIVRSMSDDGAVVTGTAQGPGSETPVVWERNGSGVYVPTRLTSSINVGGARESRVSRDGSTIVGTSGDFQASSGVKWTKQGGVWTPTAIPTNTAQVANNANRPTTYLSFDPGPQTVTPTAISADGSIIVGTITYPNPGNFFGNVTGAFMWTAATGTVDLYDHLLGQVSDTTGLLIYGIGPIPSPMFVKRDTSGQIVIGVLGAGAGGLAASVIKFMPAAVCYPPVFLTTPTHPVISACASSVSLQPGGATGTGPFNYTWYKDASPVIPGPTIWGSNVTMNFPPTLSINNAQGPDAGVYNCTATGAVAGVCNPGFTVSGPNINVTFVTPIQYTTDMNQHGDTCLAAVDLSSAVTVNTSPTVNFPALTVAGLPRTMTAWNTCAAVNNNIIGASCASTSNGDMWFKWTPDADVTVRLSTCDVTAPAGTSTVNDTVVSVFTAGPGVLPNGSDCTSTEIACNDSVISAFCAASTQRAGIDSISLTGGQSYYFRVAVKNPFTSNGTNYTSLTITNFGSLPVPANDNCATATPLLPSTNTTYSTINATTETGNVACMPAAGTGKDVWFTFSPASTGDYRISLCSGGTIPPGGTTPPVTNPNPAWDSIVTVFDACGGNEVACNDNQGSAEPAAATCSSSNVGRVGRVSLNGGFVYYIRVGGINGALGSQTAATTAGSINVFPAPAKPANDDCANAVAVDTSSAAPWTVANINTTEATQDGTNSCGPTGVTRDVWYTFTPPSTPVNGWRIQFCGQTWGDTGLSVHTGCPGNPASEVVGGCNNNVGNYPSALPSACGQNNNSRIDSVALTAGTTYWIRVGTNSFSSSGTTTSTLTIAPTPDGPANDNCATASVATIGTNAYNFNDSTSQVLAGCAGSDQRGAYDLWYAFTPGCTGTFSFMACGSFTAPIRINPVLSLHATCDDATTGQPPLGCNENTTTTPFPTLMATICPASVTSNTALVQGVTLQGGTPVLVRLAVQDFASNQFPSARAQDPTGNFYIVQNVLCCRGTTCTTTTTNPEAACASPGVGIGATKTACGAVCTGNTFTGCCYADFNKDGAVSIDDLYLYFNAYFTGSPWAKFGGNGVVAPSIDDLFLYINVYFTGCGA